MTMKARANYQRNRSHGQYVSNPVLQQQDLLQVQENIFAQPPVAPHAFAPPGAVVPPTATYGRGGDSVTPMDPQNSLPATWGREDVWCSHRTIEDGSRVLARSNRTGEARFVDGPARPFLYRSTIVYVRQYTASTTTYLVVSYRSGEIKHIMGPTQLWFDPLTMSSVKVMPVVRLNSNEALVMFSSPDGEDGAGEDVQRRIIYGPTAMMPAHNEWIETFSWGGEGGATFSRLRLVPEEFSVEIENARTTDDATLKLNFALVFRLVDIERMCDETADPVADVTSAIAADVLAFVSKMSFEEFKAFTENLNNTDSFPNLVRRAEASGFQIMNIAFRGYSGTSTMQGLQERGFERRKQLELETETESQKQELLAFKQRAELERSNERREMELAEKNHVMELAILEQEKQAKIKATAARIELEARQAEMAAEEEHARNMLALRTDYLRTLASDLSVDLTKVLVAQAAISPDSFIKVDLGDNPEGTVHLHASPTPSSQTRR